MSGFRKPAAPATLGPALAVNKTGQTSVNQLAADNYLFQTLASTAYQLDSISITAGTWVVMGVLTCAEPAVQNSTQTNYLNLVAATGSNSWPVQATAIVTSTNMVIAAVIKVSSTTTIYLNGMNTSMYATLYPAMFAVQIA